MKVWISRGKIIQKGPVRLSVLSLRFFLTNYYFCFFQAGDPNLPPGKKPPADHSRADKKSLRTLRGASEAPKRSRIPMQIT